MKTLCGLSIFFLLTSCYGYKPMKSPEKEKLRTVDEMVSHVEQGKVYRFELGDGARFNLKVVTIERENITGLTLDDYISKKQRIYLTDQSDRKRGFQPFSNRQFSFSIPKKEIKSIKRKELDAGTTALAGIASILFSMIMLQFAYFICGTP